MKKIILLSIACCLLLTSCGIEPANLDLSSMDTRISDIESRIESIEKGLQVINDNILGLNDKIGDISYGGTIGSKFDDIEKQLDYIYNYIEMKEMGID